LICNLIELAPKKLAIAISILSILLNITHYILQEQGGDLAQYIIESSGEHRQNPSAPADLLVTKYFVLPGQQNMNLEHQYLAIGTNQDILASADPNRHRYTPRYQNIQDPVYQNVVPGYENNIAGQQTGGQNNSSVGQLGEGRHQNTRGLPYPEEAPPPYSSIVGDS
jgi:hypothetical protein